MPFEQYEDLLNQVKECSLFSRWMRKDATGRESSPIELLLLGTLQYLGRGWTFDDLEEQTAINEETHRQFFHVFILFGSTVLYNKYVKAPRTKEEASDCAYEMGLAGFHGCIGSSDATHVGLEKCGWRLAQMHKGPKLRMPSRTYNVTVNHRRRDSFEY